MNQPFNVPEINMPVTPKRKAQGLAQRQVPQFGENMPSYRTDDSIFQTKQPDYDFSQSGMSNAYFDKLAGVESNGKYDAYNEGSGARGKYQFIPETEKHIAKQLGFTLDQARTENGQEKMVRRFTQNNIEGLKNAGVPINDETLWWAHNQGLGGAIGLYNNSWVNPRNLAANNGPSPEAYKSYWRSRFA